MVVTASPRKPGLESRQRHLLFSIFLLLNAPRVVVRVFPSLPVWRGSPWLLQVPLLCAKVLYNSHPATDGPLPCPRTRYDVRGATQKSAFPRTARRLASSEAAPVRLSGSEKGLQAADGPLPWPLTRTDLPCATSASFQLAPRLRQYVRGLASPKLRQDGRLD